MGHFWVSGGLSGRYGVVNVGNERRHTSVDIGVYWLNTPLIRGSDLIWRHQSLGKGELHF